VAFSGLSASQQRGLRGISTPFPAAQKAAAKPVGLLRHGAKQCSHSHDISPKRTGLPQGNKTEAVYRRVNASLLRYDNVLRTRFYQHLIYSGFAKRFLAPELTQRCMHNSNIYSGGAR